MKFVCDNCGTQYLISDEKVGPKGAKIRCKRCGNIILLRPGESTPESERQEEPSVPTDRNVAPDSDVPEEDRDELGEAFDQLIKGGLDGPEDEDEEEEHQATEIFNMEELQRLREGEGADEEQEKIDQVFSQAESTDVVRAKPADSEDREEWYVAVGDEQVGPLVLSDIEKKWESGEVGPDSLGWHPGMGDWTAIKDIPKLRYLLGAMDKEPVPTDSPLSDQPAVASEEDEWAPSGGSSLSSLVEEEMQAVTTGTESETTKSEESLEPDPGPGPDDEGEEEEGEIPPWEREDVVSGEVARPSDSFFDSTLDQSAPGDKDDTGSSRADRELARPAYLTSQTKRKSPAKMIIVTLVILIVLGGGAVAVYFATQTDSAEKSDDMTPIKPPGTKDGETDPDKTKIKPGEIAKKPAKKTAEDKKGASDKGEKTPGQKDILVVKKAGTSPIEAQPVEKPTPTKKPTKDRSRPNKRKKKKKVASSKPVERTPPPVKKPDKLHKPKDTPKPKATASTGGLPKTLPKKEIGKTMKKYVRAMRGCVKQQQQRDSTVSGTMLVSFTIGRNGKVELVRILSTEHKGTYVAGCITYIIKSIKFGKFTGDPITVPRVPLRLGG